MKAISLKKTALFFMSVALLVSCSKEIADDNNVEDNGLKLLKVNVSEVSYTGRSRAVDNGVNTSFEAGDKIGVYAVNNGTILQKNVPMTYNGSVWSGKLFLYEGCDYLAYYPYDETLGDLTTLDALKTALKGAYSTNQSTEDAYRKADFLTSQIENMTSEGTANFTMSHNMSLIELNPVCNNGSVESAVSEVELTIGGKNYIPYSIGGGLYRLIVEPGETTTVGGSFLELINNASVSFSAENITPALNAYNRLSVSYTSVIPEASELNTIALSDGMLTASSENGGEVISKVLDNDKSSYWQSIWSSPTLPNYDPVYGIYIDINLGENAPAKFLSLNYQTRSYANAVPSHIDIYAGENSNSLTKIGELRRDENELPINGYYWIGNVATEEKSKLPVFALKGVSAKHVRLAIKSSYDNATSNKVDHMLDGTESGGSNNRPCVAISELKLYGDIIE